MQRLYRFPGGWPSATDFFTVETTSDSESDLVASHFGQAFAQTIFGLAPGDAWAGPFESDHGWHLVMVTAKADRQPTPLEDVRGRVVSDLIADRAAAATEAFYREARKNYEIVVDPPGPAP